MSSFAVRSLSSFSHGMVYGVGSGVMTGFSVSRDVTAAAVAVCVRSLRCGVCVDIGSGGLCGSALMMERR